MNPNTLLRLDTPLAYELAENKVLQSDLQSSIAAMKLWHEKFAEQDSGTEEGIISKSLFRDAVIQFVGCFDQGAEFPLSAEEVYEPKGLMRLFDWFKNTRDAYAAHKFGAQRQCVVGTGRDANGNRGIGYLHASYKGQQKADGPNLIAFMQLAQEFLEKRIDALQTKVLESIAAMTDEQIDALPVAKVHTLAQGETRMSRKALHRTRSSGASSDQLSWTLTADDGATNVSVISHSPKDGTEKS